MNIVEINSTDNAQFKQLKKLATSARERRKTGKTILDGAHLLQALAESGNKPEIIAVRADSTDADEIQQCLTLFPDCKIISLSKKLFNEISPVETPRSS